MNAVILDTDVIIDILRNNQKTIRQVERFSADRVPCCSCITIGEVYAGMLPKEEKLTQKFFQSLTKIPVTEKIAELAGRMKFFTKTHQLWLDDCLIAATAFENQSVLVTKNVKHYPFKDIEVCRVF
ncbi:type II toxin-antitoxin system VapC family toxin [Candidatus Peregrinibacteria bacterium]|nr:type II toxin-antitoxin system VapC family toxin [Candidatus Peregrinibacteria bacterium]